MNKDFTGTGAAASGTTLLYNVLFQNPKICLSRPKEISCFCETDRSRKTNSNGTSLLSI